MQAVSTSHRCHQHSHSRDLYDVLSVPRGATDQQIKRAYRKLAVQYHPVRVKTGSARAHLSVSCATQDKVSGTEEEKEAAAKRFADINHGMHLWCVRLRCMPYHAHSIRRAQRR